MENQMENQPVLEPEEKPNNVKKTIAIAVALVVIIILVVGIVIVLTKEEPKKEEPKKEEPEIKNPTKYEKFETAETIILNSYEEYESNKQLIEERKPDFVVNKEDFDNYKYVLVTYNINGCGETIKEKNQVIKDNVLGLYYDMESRCGVCAPEPVLDVFKLSKNENFDKVETYYAIVKSEHCEPDIAYKPMIYVYPTKDMDLTIKLGNPNLLTSTYPKYNKEWNIHVTKDGNIYDYNTKRNYYGLYWEAKDYTEVDYKKGFVVKGEDTTKFLEEKLSLLGLNEYEINEFIVYWINKLENNKYNYIYFRTTEEVNKYMPLEFSNNPDTLIRVLVDFKPLDKPIEVKEQHLTKVERKGYTVVEWGGVFHK